MILEERSELADAAALSTAGTGRALVGDVIDLGGQEIGDLYLVVIVDTAIQSAGAATVQFELASDSSAAIATDGTATVHFATRAFPKAELIAGFRALAVKLSDLRPVPERFLGLLQNVGVATLSAGKINAFLTPTPGAPRVYADAVA